MNLCDDGKQPDCERKGASATAKMEKYHEIELCGISCCQFQLSSC